MQGLNLIFDQIKLIFDQINESLQQKFSRSTATNTYYGKTKERLTKV